MSSLVGTDLGGGLLPGGPGQSSSAGSIDTTRLIDELLPSLNSATRADLTHWTEAELIEWLDDGVKRMAQVSGLWIERDTTISTAIAAAGYTLPDRHLATLHVSYGTTPLRPAAMVELEMRNPTYETDAGTPDHWYQDLQLEAVALTPVPDAAVSLPIIQKVWPPTLDIGRLITLVQAPAGLAGFLSMWALAKARSKEGHVEMADVSAHCMARCSMYENVFAGYFGGV